MDKNVLFIKQKMIVIHHSATVKYSCIDIFYSNQIFHTVLHQLEIIMEEHVSGRDYFPISTLMRPNVILPFVGRHAKSNPT